MERVRCQSPAGRRRPRRAPGRGAPSPAMHPFSGNMRPETAAEIEPPPSLPYRGISPEEPRLRGNVFRAALPFSPPLRDRKKTKTCLLRMYPALRNGIPPLFPTLRGFSPPCAGGGSSPMPGAACTRGQKGCAPPKKNARAFPGRGGKAAPSPAGTKKTKKKPSPMPDVGKRGRPAAMLRACPLLEGSGKAPGSGKIPGRLRRRTDLPHEKRPARRGRRALLPYPHASAENALLAGEKSCPLRPSACSAGGGGNVGHRPTRPGTESLPFFPPRGAFLPPAPGGGSSPMPGAACTRGAERLCPPKKCPRLSGRGGKAAPFPRRNEKNEKKALPHA